MSEAAVLRQAAPTGFTPAPSLLQRSCSSCGASAGFTGKCSSCESEDRFGAANLQPKLAISSPGDVYEQEADRVADHVVAMPGPGPLKEDLGAAGPGLQRQIQRQAIDEETAEVGAEDDEAVIQTRREAGGGGPELSPEFQTRLDAEQSSGRPLDEGVRADMESRLGVDLGQVRVHRSGRAAELARTIHAEAFTLGSHVYFGSGYYDPGSRRGRHLLAHELTHTLQQSRGAVRHLPPGATAATVAEAGPQVQRSVHDSFVPEHLPDGEQIHAQILQEFGVENKQLFTEVKIPGATSTGVADKAGRADFYIDANAGGSPRKDGTTPAVIMEDGEPKYLPSFFDKMMKSRRPDLEPKLLKGGVSFEHKEKGAPRAVTDKETSCDGQSASTGDPPIRVCKLDDRAPKNILLGDLKPPPSLVTSWNAKSQLDYYKQGLDSTKTQLNKWAQDHPNQVHPKGGQWSPSSGLITKLELPKGRKLKSRDVKKVPLRQYNGRKSDPALLDDKGEALLPGHLAVYQGKDAGVWHYDWIPEKIPAKLRKRASDNSITKALRRLNELVHKVKSPPVATPTAPKKKALPGPPPRPAPAHIQRKEAFDKDKWPGEFKAWQDDVAKPLLGADAVGLKPKLPVGSKESQEVKALRVYDGLKDLRERIPADALPVELNEAAPTFAEAGGGGLKRLEIWARFGQPIGKLRTVLGGVFIKIADLYEGAQARFEKARAGATTKDPSSGGSIGKSIVKGVFKVVKTFFKVLLQRVIGELKRSLKQAGTVIIEDLIGEERLAKLHEAQDDFEDLVAGVEAKVNAQVEDARALLQPYEDLFKTFSNLADDIRDIMRLVNAVRWGLRIINCATPPGLGCLKLLVQSIVEAAAARVIDTCWFVTNFIRPLLSKFSIFTSLPGDISALIIAQVRKVAEALPVSKDVLDKAFAAPAVRANLTNADLECDADRITPAQIEMNKLLDKYGKAKVEEIIKLLEAAGLTKDREMTIADVKILAGLLDKIESGEVTKEDIENAVANMKAGKAAGVPNIENAIQQISGLGGGGSGGGQGKGQGSGTSGDGKGGGAGYVIVTPYDKAKTDVPATGKSVARATYRALDANPGHALNQEVTITLIGLIDGAQVASVPGVPAKVEGFRDSEKDGVKERRTLYRIASVVRLPHKIDGVAQFVASPTKLVPGGPYAIAGAGGGEKKKLEPAK